VVQKIVFFSRFPEISSWLCDATHNAFPASATAGLDSIARLTEREHFPTKREYDGSSKKRSSKKKMCCVCSARGIRTPKGGPVETTWVCEACPSMPGLCVDRGCFWEYHINFNYSGNWHDIPGNNSAALTPNAAEKKRTGSTQPQTSVWKQQEYEIFGFQTVSYSCPIMSHTKKRGTCWMLNLWNQNLALVFHFQTRSPAIAEGPRDAGVPVEIW